MINYSKSEMIKHETKKELLIKFILVLGILVVYFCFVSLRYGMRNGFLVTLLSWSFFVFCTPIADAGIIFDLPMRLVTGIRMVYSELIVWMFAFIINISAHIFFPVIYDSTIFLKIFNYILMNPVPFWIIIILSAMGTYLSVYFGDELLDVARHKERKKYFKHKTKYLLFIALFLIINFILYFFLLEKLNINIPFL